LYALSGWGPLLNKELTGRNNAFFKRVYRYGFTTKIMEVTSLLDNAMRVVPYTSYKMAPFH